MAEVAAPPQGIVFHSMNERIQLLVNNCANNNLIDFFEGISYNIRHLSSAFYFVSF